MKRFISYYLTLAFLIGCIDPEPPKFKFIEGMIYVDAYASTALGESYVTISESNFKFGKFVNDFIPSASVSFRNIKTNVLVQLIEQEDTYLPPEDFNVSVGDSWELLITLPDGRNYQSSPEGVIQPVDFSDLKATYKPDLLFRENVNDFIPGHLISLDIDDPPNEQNFYHWRYRSFERIGICERCENSIFRNGICDPNVGNNTSRIIYYWCETDCWKIRFSENIKIFSDEFNNGETINAVAAADLPYYTKGNILIEVQQYSLSESAYKYFKVLKDAVNNTSGINAPPPAALIGNVFNPNNDNEFVLGRFTAASTTVKHLFIDRSNILETEIEPFPTNLARETCALSDCPPQECADMTCDPVTSAPCTETRYRTSNMPEGWQE